MSVSRLIVAWRFSPRDAKAVTTDRTASPCPETHKGSRPVGDLQLTYS